MIPAIEQLREAILAAIPGATIEIVNSTPAAQQPSLLVDSANLYAVAKLLKEDARFQMDYCSCVTGVDRLPKDEKPGYIEVVYHLYSIAQRHGPVILKVHAPRELDGCRVPSLTPLWRGCEFQEREAFDMYGVKFAGHPDLRRILMWDEFVDYPLRKDYVPPMDYEWEPTPHDEILDRARQGQGIVPPTAIEEADKVKKK